MLRFVPFRNPNPPETGFPRSVSANWHVKLLGHLPRQPALTPPRLQPETSESFHCREKTWSAARDNFPQTPGKFKTTALPGAEGQVVCLRLFTPGITPLFAAHWSETEPRFRTEIKTAPASPLSLSATVTVLAFAGVKPRVLRLLHNFPKATTTSKFLDLIDEFGAEHLLNWKHPEKPTRLITIANFFLRSKHRNRKLSTRLAAIAR